MNRQKDLYIGQSTKSVRKFAADFKKVAEKYDFVIHNSSSMDMSETFTAHGARVPEEFDLHMIQLCKPAKSSASLIANPERSLFMPKFVMAFSKNGQTEIRYMSYGEEDIRAMVVEDDAFPTSLTKTFVKVRSMINEAK